MLDTESINSRLKDADFDDNKIDEISSLLHSTIHYTVIDIILSELNDDKKKEFLHLLIIKEDHDGAWSFVQTYIESGEEKIKGKINEIIAEFLEDIEGKS